MPLHVVRGVPPSLGDATAYAAYLARNNTSVLTGVMADTLYVACFVGFLTGLATPIQQARPASGWLASLMVGAGLLGSAVTLLGDTLGPRHVWHCRRHRGALADQARLLTRRISA
jgi:hypothetical protein